MSRNDYKVTSGEMENNHRKNQMIRDAAREVGISEQDLSDAVHYSKGDWDSGDFTYTKLLELARDIKYNK